MNSTVTTTEKQVRFSIIIILSTSGLAKSLARRPGAIVFSSRATKMYHRPARRATLNTGLPCNIPSKLRARGRTLLQLRPRRRNNVPLARKN